MEEATNDIDVAALAGEEVSATPKDIYNVSFKGKVFGGYDRNEVDAFLERVAASYELVLNKLAEAREQNDAMAAEAQAFREMEHSLRQALVSAQKMSEETLDAAKRQADALLEQARSAKERAEIDAQHLPDALRDEIDALKAERARIRKDLVSILETHASLVENIPSAESEMDDMAGSFAPEPPDAVNVDREPWLGQQEHEE
ncbi:MAG TPA: DivIVA domain-containing protein [Candidatus Hydrogenedentes bacterium]|nr:DivIVA domain-containing protein [Candidatus Hydrogenedentota bacterium]